MRGNEGWTAIKCRISKGPLNNDTTFWRRSFIGCNVKLALTIMAQQYTPSLGAVLLCLAPIILSCALWKLKHPLFGLICLVPTVGLMMAVFFKRRRVARTNSSRNDSGKEQ